MNSAKCKVQSAKVQDFRFGFRTLNSELRTPHLSAGFTYVALLAAIVIIGISLGAAGKYWSTVMQREREEELLFRGDQYRLAIERYFLAKAPSLFPNSVEDLLQDDRFPQAKRHLRHPYSDPMTGEDFELIRDLARGNRIIGVFSRSDKQTLRKTGFDERYETFEGKSTYNEWKFIYATAQGPAARPAPPAVTPKN